MKRHKRWTCIWIIACLSVLFAIGLCNFIVDPFQHYRKASFYRPFFKDGRFLNTGVARHYPYDTVILGTSMVQNFKPSYIKEKLGFESIKLAISGGSAYEERLTLDIALRTGKVRNIIFGLDVFSFAGEPERFSNGEGGMPLYLYDTNPLNDVNYLISLDTIQFYKHLIRANFLGKGLDKTSADNFGTWATEKDSRFSKAAVLEDWRKMPFNNKLERSDFELEKMVRSFELNFLSLARKHEDIDFYIFYPPYSALVWAHTHRKGTLESILAFKRRVFELTRDLPNVKLYDFQACEEITFNLDNYKDISHYSPEINDFIVDSLATDEFRVREESVDGQLRKLKDAGILFSEMY